MSLLKGQYLDSACKLAGLKDAVQADLDSQDGDHIDAPPGSIKALRLSSAMFFLKRFLTMQSNPGDHQQQGFKKSHQLFQLVDDDSQPDHDLVHRPVAHMWAAEQASGTATYLDDIPSLNGELQIVLIRSTQAHGKILKLDFDAAMMEETVVGVITADDLGQDRNNFGPLIEDEEVFASTNVQYHGQVIAGLVVKDKVLGQHATKLVRITYEDKGHVLNLQHAMDQGLDLDKLESFGWPIQFKRIQEPDLVGKGKIFEGRLRTGGQEHFYLEPNNALAIPGTEKDEMLLYGATQEPGKVQDLVSRMLDIPCNRIVVKVKRLGGAFGGKERMHHILIAAAAARKFGQPCRLILSRSEDMAVSGARHEAVTDYKVEVDTKTGKIMNATFKMWANAGSSTDISMAWATVFAMGIDAGYTLKNCDIIGKALKTHSTSSTAFRGFGWPESGIVIETILDRIAHELELDPLKLREMHLTTEGDLLHHSQRRIKGCTLQRCWEQCLDQSQYHQKMDENAKFNKGSEDIKRGLAIVPLKFGPGMGVKSLMKGSALVHVYKDGSVLISHGGVEMGQGLNTKMIQVASRALDLPADLIHIKETSSETVANASPTVASCGTDIFGPAVMDACTRIKVKMVPYKEANPEGRWKDWVTAALDDRVCLSEVGHYDTSPYDYNPMTGTGNLFAYQTYGSGAVQVEVNCQTGDVTVLSTDIVMDLGQSLNPAIDIGQIEGAFLMVLGFTTTEQLVRNKKTGQLVTDGPGSYMIPTVADVPLEFNVTLLNNKEGPTSAVYSSKGVGEPGTCMAAAIVLAIKDAMASYRRQHGNHEWFSIETPATPDKIVQAANGLESKSNNSTFIEM